MSQPPGYSPAADGMSLALTSSMQPVEVPDVGKGRRTDLGKRSGGVKLVPNPAAPLYFETDSTRTNRVAGSMDPLGKSCGMSLSVWSETRDPPVDRAARRLRGALEVDGAQPRAAVLRERVEEGLREREGLVGPERIDHVELEGLPVVAGLPLRA